MRGVIATVAVAALALPGGAAAQRVPERVPFDAVANLHLGDDPVCSGHQSVSWSRPNGRWVATLTARLDCPARPLMLRGHCGHRVAAQRNSPLDQRTFAEGGDGWIWIDEDSSATCEPPPLTVEFTPPAGEILLAEFTAWFYERVGGNVGWPTVFCRYSNGQTTQCEHDIQLEPGQDITVRYQ